MILNIKYYKIEYFIYCDRLVIKHSTELDNRPFGTCTRTIGASLGSITEQFNWICRDQTTTRTSIAKLAGV